MSPLDPTSVARKILEQVSLMATMGDVPDKAGDEMTVAAWHRFSGLDRAFRPQRPLLRAYIKRILEI
jgi:hypothetical protein